METKNTMIFRREWMDALSIIGDAERLQAIEAIIRYGFDGTVPSLEGIALVAFAFAKNSIDFSNQKYARECESRKKRFVNKQKQTDANKNNCKQTKTIVNNVDTEYETDTECDIDTDTVSPKGDCKGETSSPLSHKRKVFVPPTIEEIKSYIAEKRGDYLHIDAEVFYSFYASKGWKVGNQPMKDWKMALVTWSRKKPANPAPICGITDSHINEKFSNEELELARARVDW